MCPFRFIFYLPQLDLGYTLLAKNTPEGIYVLLCALYQEVEACLSLLVVLTLVTWFGCLDSFLYCTVIIFLFVVIKLGRT